MARCMPRLRKERTAAGQALRSRLLEQRRGPITFDPKFSSPRRDEGRIGTGSRITRGRPEWTKVVAAKGVPDIGICVSAATLPNVPTTIAKTSWDAWQGMFDNLPGTLVG